MTEAEGLLVQVLEDEIQAAETRLVALRNKLSVAKVLSSRELARSAGSAARETPGASTEQRT